MPDIEPPDYAGGGLVNLVAELEARLSGSSCAPRLTDRLQAAIPVASTYVLVLFDGLGVHQLDHASAGDLRASLRGHLDAPCPTTTTVSLATIATGSTPAEHGLIGYLQWDPDVGSILNTIHMTTAWGDAVELDLRGYLPGPNLWQRLAEAGCETVVVQPHNFRDSALSQVLYTGARFEGYYSPDEAVAVTADVAAHGNRLVFLYVPHVDVAAHLAGQVSDAYGQAMNLADAIWRDLAVRCGPDVTIIGTSDHGHIDIADEDKVRIPAGVADRVRVFGDARILYVHGDPRGLLDHVPGTWVPRTDLERFWGTNGLSSRFEGRAPDGAIFMDPGKAAFVSHMNDRLIGHHGGLSPEEREIPLLVASRS